MPASRKETSVLRLSREASRAVDGYALETLGVPGVVLMENAGRGAAELIDRWLRWRGGTAGAGARRGKLKRERSGGSGGGRVGIVCGRGNNGGDGFVIARHLAIRGHDVAIDLLGDPTGLSADAAVNHRIAEGLGLAIRRLDDGRRRVDRGVLARAVRRWGRCDVLVDALLGTGFQGEVREPMAGVIARMNRVAGVLKVAVDLPSGLDADAGVTGGVYFQADRTITFVAEKRCMGERRGRRACGRVHVVDIGVPGGIIVKRLGQGGQR